MRNVQSCKKRTDADFGNLAAVGKEVGQVLVRCRPGQVLDEHCGAALCRRVVLGLCLLCCCRLCGLQSQTCAV